MFVLFSLVGKKVHKDFKVEYANKHKPGKICKLKNRNNVLHYISLVDTE